MTRAFNFSAGPAIMPEEVLKQAQEEMLDFQNSGMSIMESSHRGKEYSAVHEEAIANFKELLNLDADHSVLFLQGGASAQFAMIPMNLLGEGQTADYVNSGEWAGKAIKEAKKIGNVNVVADCGKDIPTRMPADDELSLSENAAYLHITSNETISGAQYKVFPETSAPLIADMSSDILSRPFNANKFGLIYAGAQKNLGPSGCALVIIRNDLADRVKASVPSMLQYKIHMDNNSLYNTPPCFSIYIMMLITRWIKKTGAETLYKRNTDKAALVYDAIDNSDFYKGTAVPEFRSDMNITFRLPTEELEAQFIKEASGQNLKGLKGHRSVGGIRASIYNAFPVAGVETLVSFMKSFESKNG